MSGHSHWATIKHKKGAIDAKRGKLWSKLSRAIIIAARHGGGDPEHEPQAALRHRQGPRRSACPRTTSSGPSSAAPARWKGMTFEEITYEGYRPRRRGHPGRRADRQPQPHRRRDPQDLRARRRQDGQRRQRRLPVRAQGRLQRRRRRPPTRTR